MAIHWQGHEHLAADDSWCHLASACTTPLTWTCDGFELPAKEGFAAAVCHFKLCRWDSHAKKQAFGHLHKKNQGFGSYERSCCFNAFWDAHLYISFCITAVPEVRKKTPANKLHLQLTANNCSNSIFLDNYRKIIQKCLMLKLHEFLRLC